MSIQRWDPWRDIVSLREAMNSLLEESFVRPRAGGVTTVGMPLDLRENDNAYVVETVLPGARPEDVDISVLGDSLRISAEVRDEGERSGEKWLVRERRYGRFERTITLPTHVKADQATADFRDGILTVTLPKADAARPRSIPVRAGSTATDKAIDVTASSETPADGAQPVTAEQPAQVATTS
ncbi:MAG: heat-shock protein Hsp20 [Chloroflexi bacterium]|nr:MAG: heat-shock protein Hsp20 [Chloroflexota bacterium]